MSEYLTPHFFALWLFLLELAFIAGAVIQLLRWSRHRRGLSAEHPHCGQCRYIVVGLRSSSCPECGSHLGVAGILSRNDPLPFPLGCRLAIWAAFLIGPAYILTLGILAAIPASYLATTTNWVNTNGIPLQITVHAHGRGYATSPDFYQAMLGIDLVDDRFILGHHERVFVDLKVSIWDVSTWTGTNHWILHEASVERLLPLFAEHLTYARVDAAVQRQVAADLVTILHALATGESPELQVLSVASWNKQVVSKFDPTIGRVLMALLFWMLMFAAGCPAIQRRFDRQVVLLEEHRLAMFRAFIDGVGPKA